MPPMPEQRHTSRTAPSTLFCYRAQFEQLLRRLLLAAIIKRKSEPNHEGRGVFLLRVPFFQQEIIMDFVIFFIGIAAVAAALYYLKKSNPNKPHAH